MISLFFRNAERYRFGDEDDNVECQRRVLTVSKPTKCLPEPSGARLALGTENEQGPTAKILLLERGFPHHGIRAHRICFQTGSEQKAA